MATTVPDTRASGFPPRSLDLSGKRNRAFTESIIKWLLTGCALFTVFTTVSIAVILLTESFTFFKDVSLWTFFTDGTWTALFPSNPHYGVMSLVRGTLVIAGISALVSVPFGLMAAIYLSEYAGKTSKAIIKPVLEVLAGVPTIVYGFFALKVITPEVLDRFMNVGVFNGLSAGIAVGIMTLPLVASLSEDALSAVPRSLREAAYGLGGTRFETSVRVVVPAAVSGIIASFILAISRAIGETMIVALAAGTRPSGMGAEGPWNPTGSMQTMTGFIAQAFSGDVQHNSTQFYSLFGVGLLLFVMTFAMNLMSYWVARRFREEYQ